MAAGEAIKEVVVDPGSAEYRTVLGAFRKTFNRTVVKVGTSLFIMFKNGLKPLDK